MEMSREDLMEEENVSFFLPNGITSDSPPRKLRNQAVSSRGSMEYSTSTTSFLPSSRSFGEASAARSHESMIGDTRFFPSLYDSSASFERQQHDTSFYGADSAFYGAPLTNSSLYGSLDPVSYSVTDNQSNFPSLSMYTLYPSGSSETASISAAPKSLPSRKIGKVTTSGIGKKDTCAPMLTSAYESYSHLMHENVTNESAGFGLSLNSSNLNEYKCGGWGGGRDPEVRHRSYPSELFTRRDDEASPSVNNHHLFSNQISDPHYTLKHAEFDRDQYQLNSQNLHSEALSMQLGLNNAVERNPMPIHDSTAPSALKQDLRRAVDKSGKSKRGIKSQGDGPRATVKATPVDSGFKEPVPKFSEANSALKVPNNLSILTPSEASDHEDRKTALCIARKTFRDRRKSEWKRKDHSQKSILPQGTDSRESKVEQSSPQIHSSQNVASVSAQDESIMDIAASPDHPTESKTKLELKPFDWVNQELHTHIQTIDNDNKTVMDDAVNRLFSEGGESTNVFSHMQSPNDINSTCSKTKMKLSHEMAMSQQNSSVQAMSVSSEKASYQQDQSITGTKTMDLPRKESQERAKKEKDSKLRSKRSKNISDSSNQNGSLLGSTKVKEKDRAPPMKALICEDFWCRLTCLVLYIKEITVFKWIYVTSLGCYRAWFGNYSVWSIFSSFAYDAVSLVALPVTLVLVAVLMIATWVVWVQSKAIIFAFRANVNITFSFAFMYLFPFLVQHIIPWAPPWAPVCLWYAFLVQFFCISGNRTTVVSFRVILPLLFLLEGVSHHSFLLDLNGAELLLISFIVSALKIHGFCTPIFLMSLALQCICAVVLGSHPLIQYIQLIIALYTLNMMVSPEDALDVFSKEDSSLAGASQCGGTNKSWGESAAAAVLSFSGRRGMKRSDRRPAHARGRKIRL